MKNRFQWSIKWANMWAHQRAIVGRALGIKNEIELEIFCDTKFNQLSPSVLKAMRSIDKKDLRGI